MQYLDLVKPDELMTALGLTGSPTAVVVQCTTAANQWLTPYLTPDDPADSHLYHEADARAALQVAVAIYQSPTAAGGQPVNADFTPAPYAFGASMMRQIAGIIAPCRAVSGLVG